MADINININSNVGEQINSVTALKKAYREAMNEAASGTAGASARAADLKDRLEDLNDATKSLKGSGVEKLTASMGLLRDGFANADPGKLGTALKGLGSAMSAIPIFLVIEGIQYLVQNFDKLKDSSGLLGKAFSAIGDVIGWVVQKFKDLTDWLGLTNNAVEDNAKKTIEAAKKVGAAQQQAYDDKIAIDKASGKSTVETELLKQKAIIETATLEFETMRTLAAAKGQVSEEDIKRVTELGEMVRKAKVQIQVIEATAEKEHKDKILKINTDAAKKKQDLETAAEEFNKQARADAQAGYERDDKAAAETAVKNKEWELAEIKRLNGELALQYDADARAKKASIDALQVAKDKELADELKKRDAQKQVWLEVAAAAEQLTKALSDEYFKREQDKRTKEYNAELAAITDGENAKEAELKKQLQRHLITQGQYDAAVLKLKQEAWVAAEVVNKRAFEANKKAKLQQIMVDTFMGTSSAFMSAMSQPYPYNLIAGGIAAGVANAFGVLQYENLKATQYESTSTMPTATASSGGDLGASSFSDNASTPSTPNFDIFNSTGGGQGNNLNQTHVIKAVVVSQEITDHQTQNAYSQNMGSL